MSLEQTEGITYNVAGLTNNAKEILKNIIMAISEADDPADILRYAAYLRNKGKIRITPQIILAVAAKCEKSKRFVRHYAPSIIRRPDEVREVFAAYRELFCDTKVSKRGKVRHHGAIPNCLRKALGDRMNTMTENDILKYSGGDSVSFKDVVLMSYNAVNKKNWPLSKDMFEWVVNGEVSDSLEIATAAKEFGKLEQWGVRAKSLAIKGCLTWENIASKLANSEKANEVWEWLSTAVGSNGKRIMPYMATIRNLRNFDQHNISKEATQEVCDYIVSGAASSNMLPMRYLSAFANTDSRKFKNAISRACNASLQNAKELPGMTLVAVDTSGSMYRAITGKSTVTSLDAASVLGAICLKQSDDNSIIGALASYWKTSKNMNIDGVLNTAQNVANIDVGVGTNLGLVIKHCQENNIFPERIVLLTDGQSWMGTYSRTESGFENRLKQFRSAGWDGHIHEVHMVDYSTSAAMPDEKCHVFSTYSENIIDMILAAEGKLETSVTEKADTFNVEGIKTEIKNLYA